MAIGKVILDGSTLIDATPATASASDITAPKTAMLSNGVMTTGTNAPVVESDVNFIDYDGTLVASRTKAQINAMESDSELPANPFHTGLTSQGWNWTVAQLKAQLTAMPDQVVWVGQNYVTTSGATEIYVTLDDNNYLSPYITFTIDGTVTVDWDDNTTPDTITGSNHERKYQQHIYQQTGSYVIKITVTEGIFRFAAGNNASGVLLAIDNTPSGNTIAYSRAYSSKIKEIRLGSNMTLYYFALPYCGSLEKISVAIGSIPFGSSLFRECYSLKCVVVPSGPTEIGSDSFRECRSLTHVSIPYSVATISGNAFNNCCSLIDITIPNSVTSIGQQSFQYCYALKHAYISSNVVSNNTTIFSYGQSILTFHSYASSIPSSICYQCYSLSSLTIGPNVASIGQQAFYGCYSLAYLEIPSLVTNIAEGAFYKCYSLKEVHIYPTSPPTLDNSNAFIGLRSDCIIYVPYSSDHSILEAYKTATNWSTYASYMQEEPAP